MLTAAVAACVGFELRPVSPEPRKPNFASRRIESPKLKEFLEANLNRNFLGLARIFRDISLLTLAAPDYQPELAMATLKHMSANTK
jgi:hypothetical protein